MVSCEFRNISRLIRHWERRMREIVSIMFSSIERWAMLIHLLCRNMIVFVGFLNWTNIRLDF